MTQTIAAPSKNTLVEVVVAALSTTRLRDVGLRALKGVLASDPRLSILDGAIDLQPVWEVLESQPGFDPTVAGPPLCYVKTLEDKLGVQVRLPAPLADLPIEEVRLRASRCRPPREDIDRILNGVTPDRPRTGTMPIAEVAPPPPARTRALAVAGGMVVFLACIGFVVFYIASNVQRSPAFKAIDPAELSGDIPIAKARKWGAEVHATLSDPGWARLPEPQRRKQLERAFERLTALNLGVLILEDDAGRPKASVQPLGKTGRPYIRFY